MSRKTILLCCLLTCSACSRAAVEPQIAASATTSPTPASTPPRPAQPSQPERKSPEVQIEMRNVRLHVADGLVLGIHYLRGAMAPREGNTPVFDDQRSFILNVVNAEIDMDMASLQTLLNAHVMAYEGAPLKNVEVRGERDRLVMKGKLHKGVDLPFSTKATVGITSDGNLRLQTSTSARETSVSENSR